MSEIRKFKARDVLLIKQHSTQKFIGEDLSKSDQMQMYNDAEIDGGLTLVINNEIIACMGIAIYWEGRMLAWSIMSVNAGKHMRLITKICNAIISDRENRSIESCGYSRIESVVSASFEAGKRWIKMLGFSYESFMRKYHPDGTDAIMFVRIK